MTWILYISALIAAIAFAVLVGYLVQTLKALRTTLDNVASTVDSLEQQMTGITRETERLLNNTNKLTEDIQGKSQALDIVFDQVKEVGTSLGTLNESFKNISNQVVSGTERYSDQVEKVVEWSSALMKIWQKWKVKQKATEEYLEHKD
ncbi:DUF948 domain-containing protein [Pueribacillus sp. YX66]|uniref:DUF948 domain-containing protein n=1 Tax=Pueribacillus sp. YX66 TaxID=3229242 RepID=UPI00358D6BF7